MTNIYTEQPSRCNTKPQPCNDGLHVPHTTSEPVLNLARLTRGGAEIYRRTHRPAPTCNLIAALAGIGQEAF